MGETLFILFEVEQAIAKKVSIDSGELYYQRGSFERQFSNFTKEIQELIYDGIYKKEGKFYLQLNELHLYYDSLEKKNNSLEKFAFTKSFFEGENIEKFLLHYFDMQKQYQTSKSKNKTSSSRDKRNDLHITYLLHPDYVAAKKVLEEDIAQKQQFSINRYEFPEAIFLSLGKQLKKEEDGYYLDITVFEEIDDLLLAPSLIHYGTVTKFLKNVIAFFEQKEGKVVGLEDKTTWVERFGSEHLKRAYSMNYNCQRQYVTERAWKEHPEFVLDFDLQAKLKERPFPSAKALDVEEALRKNNKNLNLRVEWMQKPEKECEVIVIYDYLGKYLLYKKV